ncbi:MAG: type II secretion system protein GspG [Candidatus Aminicenantes bacterium]|nr:type II secretion system protein GspG [Candidatus Aminicenantes bacterium]
MKKIVYLPIVFLLCFSFLMARAPEAQEEKKNETTGETSQTSEITVNFKEQYRQTMNNLKILRTGMLDYLNDFKAAPQAKTFKEMIEQDIGNGLSFPEFYLEQIPEAQVPLKDAWGNEFIYKSQSEKFWLASAGSDGKFGGFGQEGVYLDTDKDIAGKDIIISNEGFIYFPIDEQLYRFSQRCLKLLF